MFVTGPDMTGKHQAGALISLIPFFPGIKVEYIEIN